MQSTRIFPSKAHENGVVEQARRRTESILAQMLVLRGSRDFRRLEEYQRWVREVSGDCIISTFGSNFR